MLSIENLSKQYGPQIVFQNADLFISPHDRSGLVGPNGTGKTTLFRLIAGEEFPDNGTVRLDAHRTVGLLTQESQCRLGITVREEMRSALPEADQAQADIERLSDEIARAEGHEQNAMLRQLAQAQSDLELQQAHTLDARIGRVLHGLGFKPNALDRLTDEFSGGWQMRIAMAKLLLREPDLLLLDEPTNHLDEAARKWLQNYLNDYPGAVFVISHEPQFLNKVVDRIVELDEHQLHIYPGNYHQYVKIKEERRLAQQAAHERQQRELERQQVFIDRFGAKASKATAVKSREKQLEKIEQIEAPKTAPRSINFQFPNAPKSAQDVLRLRNVSKSYGAELVLLEISFKINRGQRLALLGPNGAGKSTLLRLMAGTEAPSQGTIETGRNVITGYFAQHQAEALEASRTVLQEVLHGLELQPEGMARNLLGRLNIRGEAVFKPVGVLSGGERSRVALAKFLLRPANFLLLDEPTNHLDTASRQVLIEALSSFDGTVVLVSHDRPFINAVAAEAYLLQDGMLEEERLVLAAKGKKKS
jgi:ATP-binding cassette subfamily F protein 3